MSNNVILTGLTDKIQNADLRVNGVQAIGVIDGGMKSIGCGTTAANTIKPLLCDDAGKLQVDMTGADGVASEATLKDLDTRIADSINTGATTFGETQSGRIMTTCMGRDAGNATMKALALDTSGNLNVNVSAGAITGFALETTLTSVDNRIGNSVNAGSTVYGDGATGVIGTYAYGRDSGNSQMKALSLDTSGNLNCNVVAGAITGFATSANQVIIEASLTSMEGKLDTIDGVLDNSLVKQTAMTTDLAAIEVLQTATNASLATIETDIEGNGVILSAIDSVLDTIKVDTNAIKVDVAALEVLQTSTNTKLDTIDGVLDNSLVQQTACATDLAAIEVDLAALEVLQTSTNTKLDTMDAVLDNSLVQQTACATDLAAIEVDLAALEVLQTSTNTKLDTMDAVLDNSLVQQTACATDLAAIEVDLAALEVLQTSTNTKLDTMDAVLDNSLVKQTAMTTDLAAIEVDIAALEVLQTATNTKLDTIKLDTQGTETAVEAILTGQKGATGEFVASHTLNDDVYSAVFTLGDYRNVRFFGKWVINTSSGMPLFGSQTSGGTYYALGMNEKLAQQTVAIGGSNEYHISATITDAPKFIKFYNNSGANVDGIEIDYVKYM